MMKKVLAILLAVLVAFSAMVIPACAVDAADDSYVEVEDGVDAESPAEEEFAGIVDSAEDIMADLKGGAYESAFNKTFAFIENLVNMIHNLIGNILAVSGNECGLCGKVHTVEAPEAVA